MTEITPTAAGSPLERARRRYEENQKADYLYLDVPRWGGDLVMQIGLPSDESANSAVRTLVGLASGGGEMAASPEEMADALASAVVGLHSRIGPSTKDKPEGELEPITDPQTGAPLRFDASFGQTLGVPECSTPRAACMLAFTSGEPPALNTVALLMTAAGVGMWLNGATQRAEQSVTGP